MEESLDAGKTFSLRCRNTSTAPACFYNNCHRVSQKTMKPSLRSESSTTQFLLIIYLFKEAKKSLLIIQQEKETWEFSLLYFSHITGPIQMPRINAIGLWNDVVISFSWTIFKLNLPPYFLTFSCKFFYDLLINN